MDRYVVEPNFPDAGGLSEDGLRTLSAANEVLRSTHYDLQLLVRVTSPDEPSQTASA
ncbi:MAG: hypothetical protein IJH84_24885 [Saccharopolyspora sp.]|uniref:hypothetical protein n=1 Tax=Saccharopolyspora TaxID=1835 RepID=UPI00190BF724|nr:MULTISPECIES: hypothetical protein [unclassified Saccharopolyspora]MBK0870086.1 hypothetical protein [Saccharopolyspora sp. HNM0986]MBQ6644245.1 hypothetical protein [Saccharopolyspora sp.]